MLTRFCFEFDALHLVPVIYFGLLLFGTYDGHMLITHTLTNNSTAQIDSADLFFCLQI